jgi:hypothetical protein
MVVVRSASMRLSRAKNTHQELSGRTRFQRLDTVAHIVGDGGREQVGVMTMDPALLLPAFQIRIGDSVWTRL